MVDSLTSVSHSEQCVLYSEEVDVFAVLIESVDSAL